MNQIPQCDWLPEGKVKIASCMPCNKSSIDEAWSDMMALTNTACF